MSKILWTAKALWRLESQLRHGGTRLGVFFSYVHIYILTYTNQCLLLTSYSVYWSMHESMTSINFKNFVILVYWHFHVGLFKVTWHHFSRWREKDFCCHQLNVLQSKPLIFQIKLCKKLTFCFTLHFDFFVLSLLAVPEDLLWCIFLFPIHLWVHLQKLQNLAETLPKEHCGLFFPA